MFSSFDEEEDIDDSEGSYVLQTTEPIYESQIWEYFPDFFVFEDFLIENVKFSVKCKINLN